MSNFIDGVRAAKKAARGESVDADPAPPEDFDESGLPFTPLIIPSLDDLVNKGVLWKSLGVALLHYKNDHREGSPERNMIDKVIEYMTILERDNNV